MGKLKAKPSVMKTTGGSAAINDKNRSNANTTTRKTDVKPIPTIVSVGLKYMAAKNTVNGFRERRYNTYLKNLNKQAQAERSTQVGGGQSTVGDAFSDRFNAIMRSLEQERIEKKLESLQRSKENARKVGQFITNVVHSAGQAATINSRRDALTTLHGSSKGASRDDVVARYSAVDDTSFEMGG